MNFRSSFFILSVCLLMVFTLSLAQTPMESSGKSAMERAIVDRISKLEGEIEELMNQLPSFLQLQLKQVLTQTSRAFVPREEMSAIERALVERILVLKDEIRELLRSIPSSIKPQPDEKSPQALELNSNMAALPVSDLVLMLTSKDVEKIEGILMRAQLNELSRLRKTISQIVDQGNGLDSKTQLRWKGFLERIAESGVSTDTDALVRYTLQEAVSEAVGAMNFQRLKVKFFDNLMLRIGEEIVRMREIVGIVPLSKKLHKKRFLSGPGPNGEVMVQSGGVMSTEDDLNTYLESLEKQFQLALEDADLAKAELRKGVQKQNQTIQTVEGVSKMLQEIAAPVIKGP